LADGALGWRSQRTSKALLKRAGIHDGSQRAKKKNPLESLYSNRSLVRPAPEDERGDLPSLRNSSKSMVAHSKVSSYRNKSFVARSFARLSSKRGSSIVDLRGAVGADTEVSGAVSDTHTHVVVGSEAPAKAVPPSADPDPHTQVAAGLRSPSLASSPSADPDPHTQVAAGPGSSPVAGPPSAEPPSVDPFMAASALALTAVMRIRNDHTNAMGTDGAGSASGVATPLAEGTTSMESAASTNPGQGFAATGKKVKRGMTKKKFGDRFSFVRTASMKERAAKTKEETSKNDLRSFESTVSQASILYDDDGEL